MKINLIPIWLWIKQYQHSLRVFGGVFGAALIAAFFWMSGFDIEPIAFALGMLSSLFLASPSVAEYFYQNVNLSEI
jgi:predicted phage tail protein